MILYGMRERLVWTGMNGVHLANIAVIIGIILGIICYCFIERHIKRLYAEKTPLDIDTLELELVLKTAKKQWRVVSFSFFTLIVGCVAFRFLTIAESGYLLYFIIEIMLILCTVMTVPYYQLLQRKKAIKLLNSWYKEQEFNIKN